MMGRDSDLAVDGGGGAADGGGRATSVAWRAAD
jgi:hypothetical protein